MFPVIVVGIRVYGANVSYYRRLWHICALMSPSGDGLLIMVVLSAAQCSNYLCPGTLACVSFPHHCPCPHPDVEEKVELGEGSAVCVSKGGFKAGEATRKIELARKGLL